ncbi:uncharacterized protein ARMOST_10111 [Armillaria ostoyae]|uniref:Uncharacterized protein n=1 Tax=Armillaria ostoyae TaxID=47428 RepID=A0A284RDD6_ARMOS|nr:uncharacterized protein ARMOST_10111 [Armillaria ostoyae]
MTCLLSLSVFVHALNLDVLVSNQCHPNTNSTTASVFIMLWDMASMRVWFIYLGGLL